MNAVLGLVILLIIIFLALIYSLCVIGSDADERMEGLREEK